MAFALVQEQAVEGTSPQTATFASTPAANDLLIAVVKRNSQTGTAVSISDGGGAWTQASISPFNYNSTSSQLCLFYKLADATQAKAITASGTGTFFLSIYEFSGNQTSLTGIVDGTPATASNTTGATTSGSQPSVTTTAGNSLIFSTVGLASTVTAPGWTGATILESNASGLIQLVDGYNLTSSAGAYNPSLAWTTSRAWGQATIAFKAAAAVAVSQGSTLGLLGIG